MIILSILSELINFVIVSGKVNNPLFDTIIIVNNIIGGIIGIVAAIIGLKWYYRATWNIRSFGAKEVTSPRMAVIWWFIPLFHLWEPYRFTQQISKASNPEIMLTNGIEWKNNPSSSIVKIWWLLILVSLIGVFTVNLIDSYFLTLSGIQVGLHDEISDPNLRFLEDAFYIISIISMIFFIPMIKKISSRQEIKSGFSI